MKKFIILLFLSSLAAFGQQSEDAIYRKMALHSCRCMKGPDVFFISEETIKGCDLLAFQSLTEAEKKQVSFDNSSQEAYIAFSLKLIPHRKDYCPQVVNFLDNKKKEELFVEEQRQAKQAAAERRLAEENRIIEETKAAEDSKSADQARIAELERLLEESKKAPEVESEKESKKERKAREKREKEEAKEEAKMSNSDSVKVSNQENLNVINEVPVSEPLKTVVVAKTKIDEAVYDPVNNRLIKSIDSTNEVVVTPSNDKSSSSEDITIFGTFEELKSSNFNTIVIKDASGQMVDLLWLNKFVGSESFAAGKIPVGSKVKAIYKVFSFYNGRIKDYRDYKVIRGISAE